MNRRKKKRRIRNIICICICSILLLITLLLIQLLTGVLTDVISLPEPIQKALTDISADNTDKETPPPATEETKETLTICIDAGHGGKDIGSDSKGRNEKDDTLRIALAVEQCLKQKNVSVIMTRSDDTFLKLEERCQVANDAKAAYFVSLHRNTGDGNGVETWVYSQANDQTMTLANNIMSALDSVGISRNRGVKKGTQASESKDYFINANSSMPACIVELGFMNSDEDNTLFDQNLDAYAAAIADAILQTAGTYGNADTATDTPDNSIADTQIDTEATDNTSTSHTISNTPIENVASLDNTLLEWGQGSNVDDQNRPTGSLMYQEKFGKYNAYFIGEGDKTIYLTMDEGYECGYTPAILDTLKEKNVKAVFFVTKPYAEQDPELVQRMIDEGHMVGNHTVTHPSAGLPSQTIEQQQSEVTVNHDYIKENFNYEMHLFRYPAGKFSEQSLAIINNCNYKSVFWSFAYKDYDINNQPDPTESLNKLIEKLHPGAIYLLHAESSTNTSILGSFIDQARSLGYEFALFD